MLWGGFGRLSEVLVCRILITTDLLHACNLLRPFGCCVVSRPPLPVSGLFIFGFPGVFRVSAFQG